MWGSWGSGSRRRACTSRHVGTVGRMVCDGRLQSGRSRFTSGLNNSSLTDEPGRYTRPGLSLTPPLQSSSFQLKQCGDRVNGSTNLKEETKWQGPDWPSDTITGESFGPTGQDRVRFIGGEREKEIEKEGETVGTLATVKPDPEAPQSACIITVECRSCSRLSQYWLPVSLFLHLITLLFVLLSPLGPFSAAVQTRGTQLGLEDYSGRPFGSIPDPVYQLLVARRWTEDTESKISSVPWSP
ncbi:hypothetical protein JZ751_029955 [Albula glossodonta]|uniref:Uncharacterized protein n=1 Tax=Albula glossodonta TaxID=121402 RepID=A0A8T2NCC4_9TELE|nr:hypothetical protein JZ751_029955 [Albula glossodonta]